MKIRKTILFVILTVVIVVLFYTGFQKILEIQLERRMHNPEFIESKLGYSFPEHWHIRSVSESDDRYYWSIDGSIDDSWVGGFFLLTNKVSAEAVKLL